MEVFPMSFICHEIKIESDCKQEFISLLYREFENLPSELSERKKMIFYLSLQDYVADFLSEKKEVNLKSEQYKIYIKLEKTKFYICFNGHSEFFKY